MKKILFFALICCLSVASKAQEDSLRIKLDSLLRDPLFETTQVGLMVFDLDADTVLYQYQARQLMRPASTMTSTVWVVAMNTRPNSIILAR